MSSTLTNHAAWQHEPSGPHTVGPAPFPTPAADEVVVKIAAVAVNPAELVIARSTVDLFNAGHPRIHGFDAAGTVAAIGTDVRSFKVGDRVCGFRLGDMKDSSRATFQEYTVFAERFAAQTPDNISDAEASTIGVCLATAAVPLFGSKYLQLELPPADGSRAKSKGLTMVVWGGSTSCGSNAIQMLTAAGYDVVTTASPHNFELLKSIGAIEVVDYNSTTVVEELVAATKGKTVVGGFVCLGNEQSVTATCKVLAQTNAIKKQLPCVIPGMEQYSCDGINVEWFQYTVVEDEPMVGEHLWHGYLPEALKNGSYKIVPRPKVVGKGLENVDVALDALAAGVSATKIVVEV